MLAIHMPYEYAAQTHYADLLLPKVCCTAAAAAAILHGQQHETITPFAPGATNSAEACVGIRLLAISASTYISAF
jgi:hypothetical protein